MGCVFVFGQNTVRTSMVVGLAEGRIVAASDGVVHKSKWHESSGTHENGALIVFVPTGGWAKVEYLNAGTEASILLAGDGRHEIAWEANYELPQTLAARLEANALNRML